MNAKRLIAVHDAIMPEGTVISPAVLEISDGIVRSVAPLLEEQAMTIWLGGTIEVKCESNGRLKAYQNNKPI